MDEQTLSAAQRPRRGSGLLGKFGCVLVLVVGVLLLVGMVVVGMLASRFLASPDDVARDYVSALNAQRFGDAYGQLCADMRQSTAQRDFERQAEAQVGELGSIQRTEHVITIPRLEHTSVYWRFHGTRSSRQVEFHVVRDIDAWRVCGIEWPPL